MGIRRHNIVPFSRFYRKAWKFDMGLPPNPSGKHRDNRPRRSLGTVIGRIVLLGVVAVLVAPPLVDAANGFIKPHNGCRVLTVVDGDTVKMLCPGDGLRSARLLGFDTPEIYSPKCPTELMRGIAATWYLRWQLWTAGRVSTVRKGEDRYGRALTTLLLDGENVASRMVQSNFARAYDGGQRDGWCG
ncbi:MAG: thermonuclease family protein [Pseudorhodobacter sp.]|nr:thermonuclease family protein [Pseudorhodobacter sp.]